MELAIEKLLAINFVILGLSHITMRRAWAGFFIMLQPRGETGALINGFLSLGIGSLIVSFHDVWNGPEVLVTILGWAYVAKASLAFNVPGWGARQIKRITPERENIFIVPGVVMLAVGSWLVYRAFILGS